MEKQKETIFEPNPKMLLLLQTAIDPEVGPSISAWCKEAGVSRSQWYRWQQVDGFIDWFNDQYKKTLEGVRVALIKVGVQKALGGDFKFWQVMMEMMREYSRALKLMHPQ